MKSNNTRREVLINRFTVIWQTAKAGRGTTTLATWNESVVSLRSFLFSFQSRSYTDQHVFLNSGRSLSPLSASALGSRVILEPVLFYFLFARDYFAASPQLPHLAVHTPPIVIVRPSRAQPDISRMPFAT